MIPAMLYFNMENALHDIALLYENSGLITHG
jgi:hypothetical protein